MADTPFRTSPSAIARYFFHDCERFLRYQAAGPELRGRKACRSASSTTAR